MLVPTMDLDCPNECFHLLLTAKWQVEPSECWASLLISHWIGYKCENSNSEPLVRLWSALWSDILRVAEHHQNDLYPNNSTIHMLTCQYEVHDQKDKLFSSIFWWALSTECLPPRYSGLQWEPFASRIQYEALKAKTFPYDKLNLEVLCPGGDLFGLWSWYEQWPVGSGPGEYLPLWILRVMFKSVKQQVM